MSLAFVFPGQGSQSVGMLAALAAAEPVVRRPSPRLPRYWATISGTLCQQGPEARLSETERTQPAMLAAGIAAWRAWLGQAGRDAGPDRRPQPRRVHARWSPPVASILPPRSTLVRFRGGRCSRRCRLAQGAMAAILGLDDAVIEPRAARPAQGEVVQPVNFNSPGQVVIAGARTLSRVRSTAAKARGAKRALLLPVSVPSHSRSDAGVRPSGSPSALQGVDDSACRT